MPDVDTTVTATYKSVPYLDKEEIAFGTIVGESPAPQAQTITLTNNVSVKVPTIKSYIITPAGGFEGDTATIAPGDSATLTIQPKSGLASGTYNETLQFAIEGTNLFSSVVLSYKVNPKSAQTIKGTTTFNKTYGNNAFNLGATASAGGTLSYESNNAKVASVDSNGTVSLHGSGKAIIKITAAATLTHKNATKEVTVNVAGANQSISGTNTFNKAYGSKSFSLGAKASANGKLTYKSSNTKIATVNSHGSVSIKGSGRATITISAAATSTHKSATKKVTINVSPKKVSSFKAKSGKKKVTLSWKKDTKASGYQITYAQNKSFTKAKKIVTIKSYKTTKKTISKLKSKKTYYAKVRAYKTVSGKKMYGSYSSVKKFKTK